EHLVALYSGRRPAGVAWLLFILLHTSLSFGFLMWLLLRIAEGSTSFSITVVIICAACCLTGALGARVVIALGREVVVTGRLLLSEGKCCIHLQLWRRKRRYEWSQIRNVIAVSGVEMVGRTAMYYVDLIITDGSG